MNTRVDSFFLLQAPDTVPVVGEYDPPLVLLAFLIAVIGSYISIRMGGEQVQAVDKVKKTYLAVSGSISLGVTIWSAHFAGMMAYRYPFAHGYDPLLTGLTLAMACGLAFGVLFLVKRSNLQTGRLIPASLLLGALTATIYYMGMGSMTDQVEVRYVPGLFIASFLVAFLASAASLYLCFRLPRYAGKKRVLQRFGAAVVMAAGIGTTHCVGLLAATLIPDPGCVFTDDSPHLLVMLSVILLNVLTICLYLMQNHRRLFMVLVGAAVFALPLSIIISQGLSALSKEASQFAESRTIVKNHLFGTQLLQSVLRARGLSYRAALGDDGARVDAAEAVEQIETLLQQDREPLLITAVPGVDVTLGWARIVNQAGLVLNQPHGREPKAIFADYTALAHDIEKFLDAMAAAGDLFIGSGANNGAVFHATLGLIPGLMISTGDLRGLTAGLLAKSPPSRWSVQERQGIYDLLLKARFLDEGLVEAFNQALEGKANSSQMAIEAYSSKVISSLEKVNLLTESLLKKNPSPVGAGDYFATGTELVDSYYSLYHLIVSLYDDYLDQQAGKAVVRRNSIFYSGIIAAIGLLSLFIFIYISLARAENASRKLEAQSLFLNTLIDNIPIGIFAKDVKNGYAWAMANSMSQRIFGRKKEEMLGKTDFNLFTAAESEAYRKADEEVMRGGVLVRNEEETIKTPGGDFVAETLRVPIFDAKKEPAILLSIIEDISDKIAARNELVQAKQMAEIANQAKSLFLANMSHEIRTPLHNIIGMTQILAKEKMDKDTREMFDVLVRSSKHLLLIVNDILDLSKIESGKTQLENIPFSPYEQIFYVVQMLLPMASKKGLHINYTLPAEGLYVYGDPLRFSRIFINLVNNAITYTDRGFVTVDVSVNDADDGNYTMKARISDTGVGMSPENLKKIFEVFTQAEASTTRRFGGTGLGMAIVKELVNLMKGTIDVESMVGVGTAITLTLPFSRARKPTAREAAEAAPEYADGPPGNPTIPVEDARLLIAEDHEMNQFTLKKILKLFGILNYTLVENGRDAVEEVKTGHYDLVLMDGHMPVLGGHDATRQIRALEDKTLAAIPIVAMTANAQPEERKNCLACGMDDYISKPIDLQMLKRILSRWIIFHEGADHSGHDDKDEDKAPIDYTYLEALAQGDEAFIEELLALFIRQGETLLDRLEPLCLDGPNNDWVEVSHKLKGTAANVGAEPLRSLSARAQEMAAASGEARRAILIRMREEYKKVASYIIETHGQLQLSAAAG